MQQKITDGNPSKTPGVPFAGRSLRRRDVAIASGLAVIYAVLVMQTTDMGFTRDETFYFHYGKVYFGWFLKLYRNAGSEEGRELLSRQGVKKVWKQNSEHPPLMKVLFGASWRLLGRKVRSVQVRPDGTVKILGLGYEHGFDKGDRVPLMGPDNVVPGQDRKSLLGWLEIIERPSGHAIGKIVDGSDTDEIVGLCKTPSNRRDAAHLSQCKARTNGALQVLSESDSFRLPGALAGALLLFLLFLFAVEFGSTAIALITVALVAFIPRFFFHAHLTCFDMPVTVLAFAVIYGFFKSLQSPRWAWVTGFLFGLALLTKLNSFFVPVTLVLWWVIAGIRFFRLQGRRLHLPPLPLGFLAMPLIGVPMLFIFWPWLWYNSIQSFGEYLGFHLSHVHYFQVFFGSALEEPPFPISYPFLMTLVTVPVVTICLFAVGFWMTGLRPLIKAVRGWRSWFGQTEPLDGPFGRKMFIYVNMAFPIVLIALPSTPIFGGVKHWLLTMPFFCLVAAHALVALFRMAWSGLVALGVPDRLPVRWVAGTSVAMLLLAPGAVATVAHAEFGTGYYNELIGGVRGAAAAGMQRQFWSYAHRGVFPELNRIAPARAGIDFQDATRSACTMSQVDGSLRTDLRCMVRSGRPEFMLFDVEERFTEEEMRYWERMDTLGPVFEAGIDGVPMLRAYWRDAGYFTMKQLVEGGD
jgi:hypothetical protein